MKAPDCSQATPQRIVDAARLSLIDGGVLEVSLAEISQRAGTNVALVSYYFGNREGLMVAIAEADAQYAKNILDRLLAADISPTAKIKAHIKGLIETYFQRPYLNRLLQKLLREGSPQASARIGATFVKPVAEARRLILGKGVAAGEFREVDPGLIGFAIDGACAHIFSSAASREAILGSGDLERSLIDRYAAEVCDLVLRGLAADQLMSRPC